MSDLAEMIAVRETLYGPRFRAWLMRWLRGRLHGEGRGAPQYGRWYVGKWLLRHIPAWCWTVGDG